MTKTYEKRPTRPLSTLLLALAAGCAGIAQTYGLPRSGPMAEATLPAIADCARTLGKESVVNPDAVHVKLGEGEWLYYRLDYGQNLQMVVHAMNDQTPPTRLNEMKADGDKIWSCAEGRPVTVVAPTVNPPPAVMPSNPVLTTPGVETPTPSESITPTSPWRLPIPAAPINLACHDDPMAPTCGDATNCKSHNCTLGRCRERTEGSLCGHDLDCESNNCAGGCCYGRKPGNKCENDSDCDSINCTNGRCESRAEGSPCGSPLHCASNNCTKGRCENRTPGSMCNGGVDCDSLNCTNGLCRARTTGSECTGNLDCDSNACAGGHCQ